MFSLPSVNHEIAGSNLAGTQHFCCPILSSMVYLKTDVIFILIIFVVTVLFVVLLDTEKINKPE